MMKPKKALSLFWIPLVASTIQPVLAGEWYLVGNIGESTFQDIDRTLGGFRPALGVTGTPADFFGTDPAAGLVGDYQAGTFGPTVDTDDSDTIWRIGGGYQLSSNFAVELAYVDAGQAEINSISSIVVPPDLVLDPLPPLIRETVAFEASGIEISGLGQYPITEKFQVLGRLGVIYLEQKTTRRRAFGVMDIPVPDSEERNFKPLIGVGLQYQILEPMAIRVEWMRYLDAVDLGNSEEDIDSLSLGVRYSF
jgi:opacity protein-like surface antigen